MSLAPMTPPEAIDITGPEIRLRWEDAEGTLSAALLRASCHCTDCRRIAAKGGTVTAPAGLHVTGASPVGGYGVQLHFSDGHERGIYPWSQLRELLLVALHPHLAPERAEPARQLLHVIPVGVPGPVVQR